MKDLNDFLRANRKKKILLLLMGVTIIFGGVILYQKSQKREEGFSPAWFSNPSQYKYEFEKKHPGEIVEISKIESQLGWQAKSCFRALAKSMGQFGGDFFGQTPWTRQEWRHNSQGVLVPVQNRTHLVYLGKETWAKLHNPRVTKGCMLTFKIEKGPKKFGEKIVVEKNAIGNPNMVLLAEQKPVKRNGRPEIETHFYGFDSEDRLKIVHKNFLGQTDFHVKPIPLPSIPRMGGPR